MTDIQELTDVVVHIATTDLAIRYHIIEQRKHQQRCDARCQAWRDNSSKIDRLLDARLRYMDRRDAAALEGDHATGA